jgi:hypothetical protein
MYQQMVKETEMSQLDKVGLEMQAKKVLAQ